MGKIFGILVILVGIWVGLTIFTEGTENAFGGLFARLGGSGPAAEEIAPGATSPDRRPPTARIRDKVTSAFEAHEERTQRMIGEQ